MATPDPLKLLINTIATKRDIRLLRNDASVSELKEATHLSFPGTAEGSPRIVLPVDTPTRYLQADREREPFTLRSLVLFYMLKDAAVSLYMRQGLDLKAQMVSAVSRKKLTDLLEGKRPPDENEVLPEDGEGADDGTAAGGTAGDGARPVKKAKYVVNKDDLQAVKAILAAQDARQLNDRRRVLRGAKPNNFEGVRTMVSERIASAKDELKRISKSSAMPVAPLPVSANARRSPSKQMISASCPTLLTASTGMDPIIIVSPSSSALITMQNVKQFLEDGEFLPNLANAPRSADDVVAVMHQRNMSQTPSAAQLPGKRPSYQSNGIRTARYLVVDDVAALSKFGDEAWDRVVCVMTTGQEWQFRYYKWSEPKELFHHVRGVCFQYANAPVNDKVKAWNVVDFRIDPVKRHVDKSVVAEFWRVIEQHIAQTKPFLAW